jgi:glucoamylase
MVAYPVPDGHAPGGPGIAPTWTASDKDLVGTSLGPARLWYTLGHGIVNEVYYPRVDIAQIRDLGFIVGDGAGFWVEARRVGAYRVETPGPGIPLPTVVHRHSRFTLSVRVCPDPRREVLLLDLVLEGDAELQPYVLLAPHLGGTGRGNLAEVAWHQGRRVLWAEQGPFGLALLAVNRDFADALRTGSAGYVGASDGWQDFARDGRMARAYRQAGPGNVALTGALERRCTLALGMSSSREAAATQARAALTQDFDDLMSRQAAAWGGWHRERERNCPPPSLPQPLLDEFRQSAQVLKTHQDKTFVGAMVASLSVPWGDQGDERGGYHLVWPRDLVECAQALCALGGEEEARDTLRYLMATQNADGHWSQNQWLGGKPYWSGIQLDEAALPVLLAAHLAERGALDGIAAGDMVRRALAFIVANGPASDQDRWEEDAGVNAFTLAVCVAALVSAAATLPEEDARLATAVADFWNARLEDWCVARDTPLDREHEVAGHYVREAPSDIVSGNSALRRVLPIKNRLDDPGSPAALQIALDFLCVVRLGLRQADDPWIVASLTLADRLLRTDTPAGPVWHRYVGDGYGEHADGSAFDGSGVGRGWPLLTGERGHYALSAGEDVLPYLDAMNAMAGSGGLIPEQVWDSAPLPERGLSPGRPSGSAMPLAWAHAEFVKLVASRALGRPVDRPEAAWARYEGRRPDPSTWIWSPAAQLTALPNGKDLLVLAPAAVVLHFGFDGWQRISDRSSQALGLSMHGVLLEAAELAGHATLDFTMRWQDGSWLGWDARIRLGCSPVTLRAPSGE